MNVGYLQFEPKFGSVAENLDSIESLLTGVDADLVVLPELCTTGYQFISAEEVQSYAEPVPDGKTCNRLVEIAGNENTFIAAGLAERDGSKLYNSAVLAGPDGIVAHYRKVHLFFEENLWFSPGNEQPAVTDINGMKVGLLICFDWLFPEIFRLLALKGADIIAHPSNLVLPYCQDAMITRSIENRIFTITANRIGSENRSSSGGLTFTGMSQVTGVKGEVLSRAPIDIPVRDIVGINHLEARDKSINKYNSVLESRRPDVYQNILK